MSQPTRITHAPARVLWLFPMVLLTTGCTFMGKDSKLLADRSDHRKSTAAEPALEGAAAAHPGNRKHDADARVAVRRPWSIPEDTRVDVPPLETGPIVPVSNLVQSGASQREAERSVASPNAAPPTQTASLETPVSGRVEKISTKEFQEVVLASNVPVLVDFYADWCGPCKRLSPMLDQIAQQRTDLRVVKVNIDHDKQLAHSFGVQSIPTVIVFKDGNRIAQHTGLPNIRRALAR